MAREGRCAVCGEQLSGPARFCSGCGAPAHAMPLPVAAIGEHTDQGASVVRDRSRWPLLAGVVVVAVFAAALASSRAGETTSGADTTSTTTSAPTTTEQIAPTTTVPPDGSGPVDRADVDGLPADLADTTLILLGAGRSAIALDLGSGATTTFEIPGRSIRAEDLLVTSANGFLVSSREVAAARMFDWSFVERTELPFVSAAELADDGLWALRPAPYNQLFRITPEGFPREVRSFDVPITLVGSVEGDALVTSPRSSSVRRVGLDASTSPVEEMTALRGGTDWFLGIDCAADLTCTRRLVDLRGGATVETDVVDERATEIGRSGDGRRVIVQLATEPAQLALIDADELNVTLLSVATDRLVGSTTLDDELRYVFLPRTGVRIVSIETGEQWTVGLDQIVRRVIVAPDDWEPPEPG